MQHWRSYPFSDVRPFFCLIEAAETAIWLSEVAPKVGKQGQNFLDTISQANQDANPELWRVALKLATGAGKNTVMAMLITWQTINAVRYSSSKKFTRGFLIVTPGITIRDRLQILKPNRLPGDRVKNCSLLYNSDLDGNAEKLIQQGFWPIGSLTTRLIPREPKLCESLPPVYRQCAVAYIAVLSES